MIFASDNWAGAHPRIAAALSANSGGFEPAYGNGSLDSTVKETFSRIFEREVAVFFVGTGTAANALSLVSANKPGGVTFCHRESHIMEDECGAPEYFMGGSRLFPVDGELGRIDTAKLSAAIAKFAGDNVHGGQPASISITQATEIGTVYSPDQIKAVSAIAHSHGIALHMDGARFANALVSLGTSPAEMTWKSGVDLLSFGGTKNGCWCAEAVIMFDLDKAREFAFIRKRAAQLFSKSRFIAAQFQAYFADDLWLETATHANAMAARLADHTGGSNKARLAWAPQANEVFVLMREGPAKALQEQGVHFYEWPTPAGFVANMQPGEQLWRFVTSFATSPDEVDRFGDLIA